MNNLTTAASIWFAASIGIAIGFNLYFLAALATVYSALVPKIPHITGKKPR
ncbi:MAG: MgtC/SapB family protein [Nanoarchaeota archaeon]|nr:MgtC/SapB family protein [Nanoarchaeota archaeon]